MNCGDAGPPRELIMKRSPVYPRSARARRYDSSRSRTSESGTRESLEVEPVSPRGVLGEFSDAAAMPKEDLARFRDSHAHTPGRKISRESTGNRERQRPEGGMSVPTARRRPAPADAPASRAGASRSVPRGAGFPRTTPVAARDAATAAGAGRRRACRDVQSPPHVPVPHLALPLHGTGRGACRSGA
jgi:hypothetical protein